MELNYLRVFYEVARTGKFSESAKKLHISQSALSRSVSLLEESEGVTLFERSKKGVSLTEKGQKIFHLCDQLFKKEREIENLCRGVQEKCEGFMRFASSDHLINDFLPEHLLGFKREHPGIIPSIRTGTPEEITDFLLRDECEFALMFAKVNTPQVEFKKIHSEKMALVCHPELWRESLCHNHDETLRRLISRFGYISSIDARFGRRSSQVMLELFGEIPPICFEVNSQESQKRFCLAREGAAYLARFMVKKEIENGELFEIPVESAHEFPLWLAVVKGKQLSLASRTFLKSIAC